MNILYLAHTPLYPHGDDFGYVVYSTINALHRTGHSCTVLAHNTEAEQKTVLSNYHSITKQCVLIAPHINRLADTVRFIRKGYPFVWRKWYNPAYERALQTLVQQEHFDILFTDDIRVCVYIEQLRKHYVFPPVVLRFAQCSSSSAHFQAKQESNIFRRSMYRSHAQNIRNTEERLLAQCSGIIILHNDEMAMIPSSVHHVQPPRCIAPALYSEGIVQTTISHTLFSLLALDRPEHSMSIEWLIGNVLPLLEQYFPPHTHGTDYHLGGTAPPAHILQYDNPPEHLHLHPNPTNVLSFLSMYDIMLAPQPTLHGLPLSVLHAMAHGKAVIASPHTMRNVACTHGVDILLAETPREFVQCIGLLISDTEFKHRIQHNAREFIMTHYGSITLLTEYLQSILACTTQSFSSVSNADKNLSHD
jgi:polysaccharide biosynthesis protein PslH